MIISSAKFYSNYYGHMLPHLAKLKAGLDAKNKNYIYLVGDSSLDNKHWLNYHDTAPAVNGYETILDDKTSKCDIAYHLNKILENDKKNNYIAINCAVEESTIGARENNLLDQDKFVRDNVTSNDIIIASLGGNDIALSPSTSTIYNMIRLQYMNSEDSIKNNFLNCWGADHFINLFKDQLQKYLNNLTFKTKPKKVIVCCIYYPQEHIENTTGGWADRTLGLLGYNSNPAKLQCTIDMIFRHAIQKIKIPNCEVVGFEMAKALNSKDINDYIQRVEPSNAGGKKIATGLRACL